MRVMYLDIADPTEYSTAIALLGSWRHWQLLTACEFFKPYITAWRQELATKFESDRFQEMIEVSSKSQGTPAGVAATKWLADRYSSKSAPKRGRPSKDEKTQLLKEESDEDKLLDAEAKRVGL